MNSKYPHGIIPFKEAYPYNNKNNFVYISTFVIVVKETDPYIAFAKIEKFVRHEIKECLSQEYFTWDHKKPDYAKLVITQPFGKYDLVYKQYGNNPREEYKQDGVQSIDYIEPNFNSEFYAIRIGIVGFDSDKTMT